MMLDTRTFEPSSCPVQDDMVKPGNRRLLRMSLAVVNLGPGDMSVGAPSAHPELFHFDPCYGNFAFRDADELRLWRPDDYAEWVSLRAANPSITSPELLAAHPQLRQRIVVGRKNHFCFAEFFHCEPAFGCAADQTIGPSTHQYLDPTTCEDHPGVSVGWMDVYPLWVDGQWVEAPNEGGTFVLEQEVNTERVIEESDYMNNTASVCVNIPPKNGHDFVGDPSCITPPAFEQANDCEMCLALCASIADVNAQQSGCPCAPLVCPSSSGT